MNLFTFLDSFIYLFFAHWGFVCKCVYAPRGCLVPVEVRKEYQIDPLELKLCMVESHHMVLYKNNKCF